MKIGSLIQLGAVLGGLSVLIGAFGSHGLEQVLENYGRSDTFEIAVKYQFYHSLAILLTAVLLQIYPGNKLLEKAIWFFFIGVIIFSGSLYILSLSGIPTFGAITPFGGVALISGWISLFLAFRKPQS